VLNCQTLQFVENSCERDVSLRFHKFWIIRRVWILWRINRRKCFYLRDF